MTYVLEIQLIGVDHPKVWRQMRISPEMSLHDLHLAIQAAMGWSTSHPHCFATKTEDGEVEILPTCDERGQSLEVRIKKHISTEHPVIHYIYDFGDYWDHEITLCGVLRDVTAIPECTGGAGACPPEDSGGPAGYMQAIAAGDISRTGAERFSPAEANEALLGTFLKSVIGE